MLMFLLLVLGLIGLWYGTELTINGAVSLAKRLGVSEFIVGVAILSVGSDLPELAIAVDGAIKTAGAGDASNVVVGTAIGSTLGQIGLVLGITALLAYLTLPKRTALRHGAVLLGSIIILALMAADGYVSALEGIVMVVVYLIYFVLLWTDAGKHDPGTGEELQPPLKSLVILLVGFTIVIVAAEVTVSSAIELAEQLGVSETVIAILLIGLGTSLPELSISLGAVMKGKARMSVGNLIGSNVFDTLVPIGVAAAISGVTVERSILFKELPFLFILTTVVLFFFLRVRGLQRWEAVVILSMYGGYVISKVSGNL
ncbi:MAG: sodium:calcium antiporter [Woeseiaceae bacterium]|nr:sodium:calcium antiporter [Woeseiaceae bacterium]